MIVSHATHDHNIVNKAAVNVTASTVEVKREGEAACPGPV